VWYASRVLGLTIGVKPNGKGGLGKKTAWSGTYWEEVIEKEVTGWEMRFPDRRKIPQCTRYKYLGGYETSGWRGRHDETLATVKQNCCKMIRLIDSVPILGPEQIRRAVELAVSGICGFYGRSTPIPWATCKEIEAVRAEVLQRRGISPSSPRLPIFAPCEAGGLGHTHTYQIAASAFVDQVDESRTRGRRGLGKGEAWVRAFLNVGGEGGFASAVKHNWHRGSSPSPQQRPRRRNASGLVFTARSGDGHVRLLRGCG
jgi:hypothetical protein